MAELSIVQYALQQFAGLSESDFALSASFWKVENYRKGGYFNEYKSVCKKMGFILDGVFRSFVISDKNGDEKNVFFYSSNQFVVTFKSFINQTPCDYHTQAMTDARIVYIGITDLLWLYNRSHKWESFGRLLAQTAFNVAIDKAESLIFKTAEERYLHLLEHHPDIFNTIPLYHISSYLGIQGPSLSRIRKRLSGR